MRSHQLAAFHVVTEGGCWLEVNGDVDTRQLDRGDLVILPRGNTHWLRDQPDSGVLWLEELLAKHPVDADLQLRGGGGGAATELLCGAFAIEGNWQQPVLSALPAAIHIHAAGERALPWLATTLELIEHALAQPGTGATVVVERLSDLLLTQALRAAFIELEEVDGFNLELLRDGRIAAAVRAIHEDPARAWTLRELSGLTAMSRSAFATRFRALTGDSPIRYATRCRLAGAARELRRTDATLAAVARRAGYESEFSFSRAFKRSFGVAPGAYRQQDEARSALRDVVERQSA